MGMFSFLDKPFRTGATQARKQAQAASEDEMARQSEWLDYIKQISQPGVEAGQQALGALSGFYGLGGGSYTPEQQTKLDQLESLKGQLSSLGGGGGYNTKMAQMLAASQDNPQAQNLMDQISALETETGSFQKTQGPNQQQFIQDVQSSPFYQSMIDQGAQQVGRYAGATGGLRGGGTNLALAQNSQNVLQGLVNQRLSGLQNIAGLGQTAQSQLQSGGSQALAGIGNAQAQGVNAMAQQAAGRQNLFGGLLGGGLGVLSGGLSGGYI